MPVQVWVLFIFKDISINNRVRKVFDKRFFLGNCEKDFASQLPILNSSIG